MKAEIITIGDEILIGQIVDTNSHWIAGELTKIGVSVFQISSIQDDRTHILNALEEAQSRADIVIITGGLGPTKDDITKKTIASYFNDTEVVEYPEVIENIKRILNKVKHPFNEVQRYQAQLPSKASLLMNRFGTAPGMWFEEAETVFVSLPGVPYEMKGLITYEVLPRLQQRFDLPYIQNFTLMTYGTGESIIAERIEAWEDALPQEIKLAYLPSFGRVRLRLTGKSKDEETLSTLMKQKQEELASMLSDIIAGSENGMSLEKQVGILLQEREQSLGTAESLTGGKIAATLVEVPGSSAYFKGGMITYTAALKQQLLDVKEATIDTFTAVSKEVAAEMATGALKVLKTDYAIAVTGNAGPTTDHNDKSVGLVYIALANKEGVEVQEFNFGQPREKVINRTVTKSLELLQKKILKN